MKSVLIVGDEPTRRLISLLVLSMDLGWSCQTASDAERAFSFMENRTPDLVVADADLLLGGIELVDALKAIPRLESIPVIIISSYSERAQEAEDFGARAFLQRPFRQHEFLEILKNIFPDEPLLG